MTSNQDAITAYLASKGLGPVQIAGIEGNLKIESGFSPTNYNAKEGAIGIAQWEGSRRTALQAYARSVGSTETDLGTQLGYLWKELNGSEASSLRAIQGASSPAQAAAIFDAQFERSAGTARTARENAATAIYAGKSSGGGDGGLTSDLKHGLLNQLPGDLLGKGKDAAGGLLGLGGDIAGGATSAVTGAIGNLLDPLVTDVATFATKAGFALLGIGLVGAGLYQAFKPQIKAVRGAAMQGATVAALA